MLAELTRFRRDLHQIPELDFDLPKTRAYITNILSGLNCRVFSPAPGAVCAFFDAGKNDSIAFRSDMDALPVSEHTGVPFASFHSGKMHACGHDGHMAMLLALAHIVNDELTKLPHNVLLIFQPAEETTGGAKGICDSGIFAELNVLRIFGFHLWPDLPAGTVASRDKEMLAKSSEITISITGKSVHIARAFEGADALFAGVEYVRQAYQMVENEVPANEYRLLKFGKMESGTVRNAISAHTEIQGSLRSFTPAIFELMRRRLLEIAVSVGASTGCELSVNINEGYPPVINDSALYKKVMADLGPDAPCLLPEPFMIAEDFSFYQLKIPGLFFLLGTGQNTPLHSDRFQFDESVLVRGVEMYKKLLYLA